MKSGRARGASRRAERILKGGWVWPGAAGPWALPAPPFTGSVALADGDVLALGSDDEIDALRGPDTEVLDMRGLFVFPGFQDAHVHLLTGGFALDRLDLRGARSPRAFVEAVRHRAIQLPAGSWILGGGWDDQGWGGPLPDRDWIDSVTEDHPLILNRTDMHIALANGRALELAGIREGTADPPHGEIDRDPSSGRPTGILREAAISRVWEEVPAPTTSEWREALERAAAHVLERGVTQVHDMGMMERPEWSWDALRTLRKSWNEGSLSLRVRTALPVKEWKRVAELVREEGPGDGTLRWDAVKGFVDGSLGARTAWFHEPYRDDPGVGCRVTDEEELAGCIRSAAAAGLRPITHAIGDRANDWILALYREVEEARRARPGAPKIPLRIEHAQHLTPLSLRHAATPGVVLSVQPAHLTQDGGWLEGALGTDRLQRAYPFRTLLDGGARLAFGSDWTVAPVDPLEGIAAAVQRRVRGGRDGSWTGKERIEPWEAVRAYTAGAAHAVGESHRFGSLHPGKAADLTVLSGNPLATPVNAFGGIEVAMTVVGGRVHYSWTREPGAVP